MAIGPWQIEASFTKDQKFDRCMMSRTTDTGLKATFARDQAGTSLTLTSVRWKLDSGKTYPVDFVAGNVSWKADVTATAHLEVRGAGTTLTVPLDKSAAALARLERCGETNKDASETNPFVAPKPWRTAMVRLTRSLPACPRP